MHGTIEDFLQPCLSASIFLRTVLATEDGLESCYVQQIASPIDQTLVDLVQDTAAFEQQIAAVLAADHCERMFQRILVRW
jgi:hypothetical protein